ncbi:GntR family transcriptional regulator [Ramlibacter terrae]|uniref:GntR family transcriptional regulator n=1 Tax=Ramlibacter terrae TaxID=2732511 RepID=A0ABX6P515_9BURK|nr:GntR family transcriptional regulator [Ramlibacter terrae]
MKARKSAAPAPAPSFDDPSLPRGEQAYRYLRAAIQSGSLKPGDRLREGELALHIGLSRTPIREALAKLEADGLVVHDASRGIMVAELDYRMVTELYYMREVLEGTAARLPAQHASEVEISILEDLCRQYGESLDNEALLEQSNRHFHDTLYRCSHNRYLISMVNGLHDTLSLLGRTTLAKPERAEETLREHRAIVDAITNRDADAAEQALRNHIRAAQKVRMTQLFTGRST